MSEDDHENQRDVLATGHRQIQSHRDYVEFLAADLTAHGLDRWRLHYRLTKPELYYQRLLRRAEYAMTLKSAWGRLRCVVARVRLARASLRSGISIPPGVFGPGLSIAHYGSIVVNDKARAGSFVRLHSATNIGQNHRGFPVIGSHVYIGPGAVIYGAAVIGDHSRVGANAIFGDRVAPRRSVIVSQDSEVRKGRGWWLIQPGEPEAE
jgi:serine O-acetyltransferase